jgi:hypothetical protein
MVPWCAPAWDPVFYGPTGDTADYVGPGAEPSGETAGAAKTDTEILTKLLFLPRDFSFFLRFFLL